MYTYRNDPFVLMKGVANPALLPLLERGAGALLGRRLAVVRYDAHRTGQPHELVALCSREGSTGHIPVGMADR